MATQRLILAANTPVNLVSELNLVRDSSYVLSVRGTGPVSLWEGGAVAPAHREGHPIPPGGSWSFSVGADPIWTWSSVPSRLVVSLTA